MVQIMITAAFASTILIDYVPKIKEKHMGKLEAVLYAIMMILSYIVLILNSIEIIPPSPFAPIDHFIRSVFHIQ